MSEIVEKLMTAQKRAATVRPRVGGFPYLAEALRQAGVLKNRWHLPACQSLYLFEAQAVVLSMEPLLTDPTEVPEYDEAALIRALRSDQAGESTFPEFLKRTWQAGVVCFEVDFIERTVTYEGALGGRYVEAYPPVTLNECPSATTHRCPH